MEFQGLCILATENWRGFNLTVVVDKVMFHNNILVPGQLHLVVDLGLHKHDLIQRLAVFFLFKC